MEGDYDMSAEKYVKDIVSKIKCTGAKKKEIEKQLLSDISMRMEQGESLEQIMESMGTAQEIADAFSQNLPEAERKIQRKKRIGIIIVMIVTGVFLLGAYVWWIFPKPLDIKNIESVTEEAVDAQVETVVTLLNGNDFEALRGMAVGEMQNVLTQEVIDQARDSISDDWGEMLMVGSTYMQGIKQKGRVFIITQTDVMYENVSVTYTITFDEDLKLAGVYMR